mmetsp:Transcript_58212/g.96509  ORF Transcript_58212/g.96509 Transcript_58212/m.96509 type:complete len:594 (-) Transcript_58212:29-1810(-)
MSSDESEDIDLNRAASRKKQVSKQKRRKKQKEIIANGPPYKKAKLNNLKMAHLHEIASDFNITFTKSGKNKTHKSTLVSTIVQSDKNKSELGEGGDESTEDGASDTSTNSLFAEDGFLSFNRQVPNRFRQKSDADFTDFTKQLQTSPPDWLVSLPSTQPNLSLPLLPSLSTQSNRGGGGDLGLEGDRNNHNSYAHSMTHHIIDTNENGNNRFVIAGNNPNLPAHLMPHHIDGNSGGNNRSTIDLSVHEDEDESELHHNVDGGEHGSDQRQHIDDGGADNGEEIEELKAMEQEPGASDTICAFFARHDAKDLVCKVKEFRNMADVAELDESEFGEVGITSIIDKVTMRRLIKLYKKEMLEQNAPAPAPAPAQPIQRQPQPSQQQPARVYAHPKDDPRNWTTRCEEDSKREGPAYIGPVTDEEIRKYELLALCSLAKTSKKDFTKIRAELDNRAKNNAKYKFVRFKYDAERKLFPLAPKYQMTRTMEHYSTIGFGKLRETSYKGFGDRRVMKCTWHPRSISNIWESFRNDPNKIEKRKAVAAVIRKLANCGSCSVDWVQFARGCKDLPICNALNIISPTIDLNTINYNRELDQLE